jgi:hypothetical protein
LPSGSACSHSRGCSFCNEFCSFLILPGRSAFDDCDRQSKSRISSTRSHPTHSHRGVLKFQRTRGPSSERVRVTQSSRRVSALDHTVQTRRVGPAILRACNESSPFEFLTSSSESCIKLHAPLREAVIMCVLVHSGQLVSWPPSAVPHRFRSAVSTWPPLDSVTRIRRSHRSPVRPRLYSTHRCSERRTYRRKRTLLSSAAASLDARSRRYRRARDTRTQWTGERV